jgi:hypothetical protein
MELDEMKNMWQQYDKVLQQNKMLNERIIDGMLKDKSKNAINKMLQWEWANLITAALLLVIFFAMWAKKGTGGILVSYFVTIGIMAFAVGYCWYKIQLLGSIDPGGQAVTEAGKKIEQFRLIMAKERLYSLIPLPGILLAVYAIITYWVTGSNVFDNISAYMFQIILASVATLVGALVIYRKIYFDGIKQIKQNLEEIERFKQDE